MIHLLWNQFASPWMGKSWSWKWKLLRSRKCGMRGQVLWSLVLWSLFLPLCLERCNLQFLRGELIFVLSSRANILFFECHLPWLPGCCCFCSFGVLTLSLHLWVRIKFQCLLLHKLHRMACRDLGHLKGISLQKQELLAGLPCCLRYDRSQSLLIFISHCKQISLILIILFCMRLRLLLAVRLLLQDLIWLIPFLAPHSTLYARN